MELHPRRQPITATPFWPVLGETPRAIAQGTVALLGGAVLFGVGWGLVGFCPGPALTALGTGNIEALIFTVTMLIGMLGHEIAFPASKTA